MRREDARCISAAIAFSLFASTSAVAIDAQRYVIVPRNAGTIDIERDHYSVSFLLGWVSEKDDFFKALFSEKKDGLVQITSTTNFKDGLEPLVSENTAVLQDLRSNTSRPIGQAIQVLDQIPGDANTRIAIKVALHREDIISLVLKSLEDSRAALPTDVFAAPWVGYSKAVSGVLTRLFGTSSASYPFYWLGDIQINDVLEGDGKMKEHYIVLISPQRDNDEKYRGFQSDKLEYDQVNRRVVYDNRALRDWSYVVLRIARGREAKVDREIYESSAPWAVLARNQFLVVQVADGNLEQVKASAQGLVNQLKNQLGLLLGERRFSKRNRAVALHTFATRSIEAVAGACTRLQVAWQSCPTWDLEQIRNNAAVAFGIQSDEKKLSELAKQSASTNESISKQFVIWREGPGRHDLFHREAFNELIPKPDKPQAPEGPGSVPSKPPAKPSNPFSAPMKPG